MDLNPRIFIAPAICLALGGMVLFRMVANSASGGMRILVKLIGFLVMIGGIVLTCLLIMGKIG
jgi:hypothetical protein